MLIALDVFLRLVLALGVQPFFTALTLKHELVLLVGLPTNAVEVHLVFIVSCISGIAVVGWVVDIFLGQTVATDLVDVCYFALLFFLPVHGGVSVNVVLAERVSLAVRELNWVHLLSFNSVLSLCRNVSVGFKIGQVQRCVRFVHQLLQFQTSLALQASVRFRADLPLAAHFA